MLENLRAAGVQNGRRAERLTFDVVESYAGTHIQAVGIREDASTAHPSGWGCRSARSTERCRPAS